MKKMVSKMVWVLLIGLYISCETSPPQQTRQDRILEQIEREIAEYERLRERATLNLNIEEALERASKDIAKNFTARSRIAIVYITAQDKSTTEFITGELEHILQKLGFVIIDRTELDRVRAEQQFGASGEVDDSTAARIGHIAGASIIITGRVDGEGSLRRLRLRALDTTTAQVIGTASERI
jgi:hypothetical protein